MLATVVAMSTVQLLVLLKITLSLRPGTPDGLQLAAVDHVPGPTHVLLDPNTQLVLKPLFVELDADMVFPLALEYCTSTADTLLAPVLFIKYCAAPEDRSRIKFPAAPVNVSVPLMVCVEPAGN